MMHTSVMSVATVQQQLRATALGDHIEIAPYLSKLCDSLATSMIGDRRPLSLSVRATGGTMDSGQAVSVGLIVTELAINALKHAFPGDRRGELLVSYDVDGNCWRLSVSNDGVGRRDNVQERVHAGLGTSTIDSLAHQLKARVDVVSGLQGMSVMLTHVA